jgi:hypothetical protein
MIVGYRDFVDGKRRPVDLDEDGHEYVINDAREAVNGTWLLPPDDPVIVLGGQETDQ